MTTPTEKHHWTVMGSILGDKGYRLNRDLHILCGSARRAIELAEARIPGITIHSVQRAGRIDFIDDGPDQ